MSDERARFEVLLEEVRSQFGVLADGQLSLRQAIDSNHAELSAKIDEMGQFKVSTTGRLSRIEHHVGLNGVGKPPKKRAPTARPKRKK